MRVSYPQMLVYDDVCNECARDSRHRRYVQHEELSAHSSGIRNPHEGIYARGSSKGSGVSLGGACLVQTSISWGQGLSARHNEIISKNARFEGAGNACKEAAGAPSVIFNTAHYV